MTRKKVVTDPEQRQELDRWECKDFRKRYEDTSDFVSRKALFIICGCGRSGTSLLRVMLDTHSLLACGPESMLFLPVPIKPKELHEKFEISLFTPTGSMPAGFFVDRVTQAFLPMKKFDLAKLREAYEGK